MTYAYARVSAKDQNLERQLAAFCEFGIAQDCVFAEKESGKDFEREEYKRLLKRLKEGDLLVIQSIDRLGRSYGRIIEEWHRITKEIGADILVLDMPLLDTRVRSDSLVYRGRRAAGAVFRGGERAGKDQGAAGRGDTARQGKGRPLRPPVLPVYR